MRKAPIHAARRPRSGWSNVLSSRRTFASAGSSFSIGVWTVMDMPSSFRSFRPPAPRGEGREAQTADAGSTRFRLVSHLVLGAGATPRRGRSPRPVTRIPCARSEEHTYELHALMRISHADVRLKQKNKTTNGNRTHNGET